MIAQSSGLYGSVCKSMSKGPIPQEQRAASRSGRQACQSPTAESKKHRRFGARTFQGHGHRQESVPVG
jgi:hypothetical protein